MTGTMTTSCILAAVSVTAFATSVGGRTQVWRTWLLALIGLFLIAIPPRLQSICVSVLGVQSLTCILACIAFKLFALAMGRGVLARELAAGCGLWRFTGALLLPVIPTNTGMAAAKNTSAMVAVKLQKAILKLGGFALLGLAGMAALHAPMPAAGSAWATWYSWLMPIVKPILFYISGMGLWLEVDGMGDITDALALGLFGITAEPHFHIPVLAASLSEFWGKRWNLTISTLLREMVFEPICEQSLRPKRTYGPPAAPSTASHQQPLKIADAPAAPEDPPASSSNSSSKTDEAPAMPLPPDASQLTSPMEPASKATATPATGWKAGTDAQPESKVVPRGMTESKVVAENGSPGMAARDACNTGGQAPGAVSKAAGNHNHNGAPKWRKFFASCCTFTTSGVWHEIVFSHMTGGHTTRGQWIMFFLLQAPSISLEAALAKRAAKVGLTPPRWLAILLVNLICAAYVYVFWIPPMMRPLPNPCGATPPTVTLLELIQTQGLRDVQRMARVITASVPVLGSITASDAGLGTVVNWVRKALNTIMG